MLAGWIFILFRVGVGSLLLLIGFFGDFGFSNTGTKIFFTASDLQREIQSLPNYIAVTESLCLGSAP